MQKILYIFLGLILGVSSIAYAATQPFNSSQVGTGASNGYILQTDGTLSSWVVNSSSGSPFPFTPRSYGNSTSTTIGFLGGLVSNGSTTVTGLTSGLVGNNNGLLYGFASSSLFGFIPSNFSWPFPLSGGTATSTGLGIYASTTIGNGSQTGGLVISGGATTTGNLSVAGALLGTNALAVTGTVSVSGNFTSTGGNIQASGNVQAGSGNGFVWSNGNGLKSGSSANFTLNNNGSSVVTNFSIPANDSLQLGGSTLNGTLLAHTIGLGTSTPFAQFTLIATSTNGLGSPINLFAIASTTGGTSTSTLLVVNNVGQLLIGNPTIDTTGSDRFQLSGYGIITNNNNTLLDFNSGGSDYGKIINNSANKWSLGYSTSPSTNGTSTLTWTKDQVGIGTTSPYAQFSIHANAVQAPLTTLFAIGSSTATATTTLFSVSNTGLVTGQNFSFVSGTTTGSLAILGSTTINSLNLSNALAVSSGGTGASTLTGCLTGNGTNAITGSGTCNTTNATVSSIATNNGLTGGTITTTGTIGLATINAGVLGAQLTGAVPTSQATSTLYGVGTPGQILAFLNGGLNYTATTTFNSPLTYSNGAVSCASCLTANQSITLSGAVTGTGATAITTAFGSTATANSVLANNTGGSAIPSFLATSSLFTLGGGLVQSASLFQQVEHPSFQYSTSTAWTGTTTIMLQIGYGQVFNSVRCATDVGTLGVDFYHASSHLNYIPTASTTANTNLFTTNATITDGDLVKVDIGTAASSPTKIVCTIKNTY